MKIKNLHVFSSTLILLGATGCQIDTSSDGSGGKDSLVNIALEPAGDNCPVGGQRIESGLDADNNGILDEAEIEEVTYVCSQSVITALTEPSVDNCPDGGTQIDSGVDDNGNGVLEADEVDASSFICNGTAGVDGIGSLVNISAEPAGANCAAGGYKIDSGVDDNGDKILDAAEIDGTPQYLCNGEQGIAGLDGVDGAAGAAGATGATGAQGASSLLLVTMEPEGPDCALGGYRIQSGVDDNGNSILDGGEVDYTSFLCNEEPVETPLNDTGILNATSYGYGSLWVETDCSDFVAQTNFYYGSNWKLQDCSTGYDWDYNEIDNWESFIPNEWKIGGGVAGFDFTPLSVASDSCVKDNLTGLVWEVKKGAGIDYRSNDTAVTLAQAKANISLLNSDQVCGFNDWRLPTLKELQGIVNYNETAAATAAIDTTYFTNATNDIYWTSDSRGVDIVPASNFVVDFGIGEVSSEDITTSTLRFRAVRGGK